MKKFWKKTEGFTLVELIVVIAILGILAGIGTVGYSGYVKKANMAADQQLAHEIEVAVNLEYINNPNAMVSGTHYVILSKNDAQNASSGIVADAIKNAFGNGAVLNLQHDWGDKSGNIVGYFDELADDSTLGVLFDGTATPSFANDVDDLFVVIRDTANEVAGEDGSGVVLVQNAADSTLAISAANFANYWTNDTAWDGSNLLNGETYNESLTASDATIANAAVIKARNTSFATYLRDNYNIGTEAYNYVANYSYGTSIIPQDIGSVGSKALANALKAAGATEVTTAQINEARTNYFGTGSDKSSTQAYADALAYYTMMKTVNNIEADSGEAYWDQMKTGVSLYGAIATGKTTVSDLTTAFGETGDGVMCLYSVKDGKVIGTGILYGE